jgi:radial spoke head protein 3
VIQIEDSDKLFNFDAEAKPLLNVLISKTLAQALAEVKEEMEMASIVRERHMLVASKREAERIDKKLEDDAKTAFREKEQKKRDQALRQQRIRVMRDKVLAWQLARSTIVPDAIAAATRTLTEKGVFYSPVHRDLMQWLTSEIYSGSDVRLRLRVVAASLLDGTTVLKAISWHACTNQTDGGFPL